MRPRLAMTVVVILALSVGIAVLADPTQPSRVNGTAISCTASQFVMGDGSCSDPVSSSIPTGLVVMSLTTCPAGFAEETTLAGKFALGTLAANGNVTGTGGADNITPAGTNSTVAFTPAGTNSTAAFTPAGTVAWPAGVPTASGASVADHAAHTHTFTGSSNAATPDLLTLNTASTGVSASGTTGNPSATLTHTVTQPTVAWPAGVPTFTGGAGTVPAQTFTGSAGTVPAETFTGTSFDNRPAFVRVIFCKKT